MFLSFLIFAENCKNQDRFARLEIAAALAALESVYEEGF